MKAIELDNITGTLSKPSKMPGWSYGIPAKECKTGSKLAKIPGTVCHGCYALKGCYVFKNVQEAQYKRLKAIDHPLWTKAMAAQILRHKSKWFRWHDSGDIQSLEHLKKIFLLQCFGSVQTQPVRRSHASFAILMMSSLSTVLLL